MCGSILWNSSSLLIFCGKRENMKNIFRGLVILAMCFASAKLQSAPMEKNQIKKKTQIRTATTKMDCKNSSSNADMRLTIAGVITTVNHGTTYKNINIPSSVASFKIRPSLSSLIGIPITIQKSALNVASDDKYDIEIRTVLSGIFLIVTVYSLGEKIGQGKFTVGV